MIRGSGGKVNIGGGGETRPAALKRIRRAA
jgi:hypothetical protein